MVSTKPMDIPGGTAILLWCHKCGAIQWVNEVDGRRYDRSAVRFPANLSEPPTDCNFDDAN
jgi:hypothetical protein